MNWLIAWATLVEGRQLEVPMKRIALAFGALTIFSGDTEASRTGNAGGCNAGD